MSLPHPSHIIPEEQVVQELSPILQRFRNLVGLEKWISWRGVHFSDIGGVVLSVNQHTSMWECISFEVVNLGDFISGVSLRTHQHRRWEYAEVSVGPGYKPFYNIDTREDLENVKRYLLEVLEFHLRIR